MKKLLLLAILSLFLLGCGAGEMRRGASWKNWEQGWWGKEIPYIPAD
jgi:hypothetical protein